MTSKTTNKFLPDVSARAVRMALDHEVGYPTYRTAIMSVPGKIDRTAQRLSERVSKAYASGLRRSFWTKRQRLIMCLCLSVKQSSR